jgi:hypothetical protein
MKWNKEITKSSKETPFIFLGFSNIRGWGVAQYRELAWYVGYPVPPPHPHKIK